MSENTIDVPSVYVVRADNGRYTQSFLNHNYAGIGWFPDTNLEGIRKQGKESLIEMYQQYDPDASKMRIAQNVGQIWRFLDELTPGSLVLTPMEDSSTLIVGRITGSYYYEAKPPDSPYPHRKPVEWFKEYLLRSTLSVPMQNTLGSIMTIFQVRDADEILELYQIPLPERTKQVAITENEITKLILNQILELTADEFEILITELLSAIGFESEHVGKVGDDGIDVKGKLRVYQFASVNLHVQVKRYARNRIDHKAIMKFRATLPDESQAAYAFVTTSDFSQKAREEANREHFKKIGLINGIQLVGILIEHYDDLSQELKSKLNLRKTLIPTLKSSSN